MDKQQRIYLDWNATTPLKDEVLAEMLPFLRDQYGNPSSTHWWGQQARRAIDRSRRAIAKALGCRQGEITFLSGGTEANNLALRGLVDCDEPKKSHIITSAIEHPCILATAKSLEATGVDVDYVPVDALGHVRLDKLERLLRPNTALVSIMLANNDVGTIQPIKDLSKIVREKAPHAKIHSDAVQAIGKIPVQLDELDVDMMSISAHKLCGPKGVGCLYVRQGITLTPQITGGGQELRRRSGTENVCGIVGLGSAMTAAVDAVGDYQSDVSHLRDQLFQLISDGVNGDVVRHGPTDETVLPNTLSLAFQGLDSLSLLVNLDLEGIAVSSGSACSSGRVDPSHVLSAMGVAPELAMSTLRLSLGCYTSSDDITRAGSCIAKVVNRLRETRRS